MVCLLLSTITSVTPSVRSLGFFSNTTLLNHNKTFYEHRLGYGLPDSEKMGQINSCCKHFLCLRSCSFWSSFPLPIMVIKPKPPKPFIGLQYTTLCISAEKIGHSLMNTAFFTFPKNCTGMVCGKQNNPTRVRGPVRRGKVTEHQVQTGHIRVKPMKYFTNVLATQFLGFMQPRRYSIDLCRQKETKRWCVEVGRLRNLGDRTLGQQQYELSLHFRENVARQERRR